MAVSSLIYYLRKAQWNEGKVDPYCHTCSHPAITEPDTLDLAQVEMEGRQALDRSYSGKDCFASRIVCGECGGLYGSKVWYLNALEGADELLTAFDGQLWNMTVDTVTVRAVHWYFDSKMDERRNGAGVNRSTCPVSCGILPCVV